ncbi:MAG: ABC transporter ATP-binding protein [Deltaproteobacteria bacterium]|nr:ABC transporter ATP-binding protein [Deltaproteobacteria bacterium]
MSILSVNNLHVEFATYGGNIHAVRGVDLLLEHQQTLAIVGESGCGKSVTVQAIMGLIPTPPGRITNGSVKLHECELIGLNENELNRIRGKEIGMIFQDPMTSLNPTMTVGKQVGETLITHLGLDKTIAKAQAIKLLERVQIPEAKSRIDAYPFQLSGGMRQRVMIAMAIACKPAILIADEPTTALDVTVQAQILKLLADLQRENGMAIILITHDLGVVAQMAQQVAVMYGGQIVEQASVDDIFYRPAHPYTIGLRAARPRTSEGVKNKLAPIAGSPPDLFNPPSGCAYAARCPHVMQLCVNQPPPLWLVTPKHQSRCWLHHSLAKANRPQTLFTQNLISEGASVS